jgi:hypothetical protein
MEQVYLSRRNLLVLLAKLDANKVQAGTSACTLVKQDTIHPVYPCSDVIQVTAVEDAEYYTDRRAGAMHPRENSIHG